MLTGHNTGRRTVMTGVLMACVMKPDNRRREPRFLSSSTNPNRIPSRDGSHTAARGSGKCRSANRWRAGRWQRFCGGRRSDSAMVRIYNSNNEQIRTLRWAIDSGFNRLYWGMEEKGFQPGSPKPQPGYPEPGGFRYCPEPTNW